SGEVPGRPKGARRPGGAPPEPGRGFARIPQQDVLSVSTVGRAPWAGGAPEARHTGGADEGEREVVLDTGKGSSGTLDELVRVAHGVGAAVESVIEGKSEAIRLALTVLLAEGHLLIEDVPGVGKTMLAKALARSTGCSVRRIQFTPDLLPSDITGVS